MVTSSCRFTPGNLLSANVPSQRQGFAARLWHILAFVVLGAFFAVAGATQARAQSIDWLLNLSDSGSDPTAAGGTISYALTIENNGFDPAPATTLFLNIPATTTFVSATGSITGCTPTPSTGPSTVRCDVPALASRALVNLAINVRTTRSGTVSLTASVPAAGDADTLNNSMSEATTVTAGADMSLALSGPASAASGQRIIYSFTTTNNGPDTASSIVLQFPVPTGITAVTAPAGCTLGASTYNCTIAGPITAGASVSSVFQGQISAAAGSTVTAVGSVEGGSPPDPIASNNGASVNTSVTPGSDLRIVKTRSPAGALVVGGTATFTLASSYTGDAPSNIVVTDTLPATYAIDSVTAPGWTCTTAGQTVECARPGGGSAGAGVSLGPISIATTVVASGTATNTATITASGPTDPDLTNNSDDDGGATISAPTIDLRAHKSGPSPAVAVVGTAFDFRISTSNIGTDAFSGTIQMTDTLPAGVEIVSINQNGWTCTPATPITGPATIICALTYTSAAPLRAGTFTPSVTLTSRATASGNLINRMSVQSSDGNLPDTNAANDSTSFAVTSSAAGASADIGVLKTADLASLPSGDIQTFSLEVTNSGAGSSQDVQLTDNLTGLVNNAQGAVGAGFIGASIFEGVASGVSCSTSANSTTSRLLNCTIADLPVCTSGVDCPVITVQVRPGGNASARTNTASVSSATTPDLNNANNSATAGYVVTAQADVTVTKAASPDPATTGQNLTYVITAQNRAVRLSSADNVTITDTLPADVTFISATPTAGTCTTQPVANSVTAPGNDSLVCNLGTLATGAQQTVTVEVRPNLITRGTTLRNEVDVTTTTFESEMANNSATTDTPVQTPVVDLLINKIDLVDPIGVGEDTVYDVTVSNLGPSAAEDVRITDVMPAGQIAYRSHIVPADGTCGTVPAVDTVGGTLECTFPVLAAGETRVIRITGRGVVTGTGTNNASVQSAETLLGFETNPSNDAASETTTVRNRADVEVVSKVAIPSSVTLREPFTYLITVRNNPAPGRTDADDTQVTDTLPTGMVLTGTPSITVISGTTSIATCTGTAGDTAFTCDLGSFSSGGEVQISVPLQVDTILSSGQSFTNTATVTTTSLDDDPTNDSNSGAVTVVAGSLSGTVFRDFADDGAVSGGDTGIASVLMTLTGTALDGSSISRTETTDSNGNYTFSLLPEGAYTITQGPLTEAHLTDGTTAAGTEGGTVAPTAISGISLPALTDGTGYLFPKVPQARVAIAKAVLAGPVPNADGSFDVTFRLVVSNLSLEPLSNVIVSDVLQGASPLFGTFTASRPTVSGTYTVTAAPSGSCGGLNAGFDGAGTSTTAAGFTLGAGSNCAIDLALRVLPTNPLPPVLAGGESYRNQAEVTAEGTLSGQTSMTNPQLADLSDDGANPDANGNGLGNEAGENDPTPVAIGLTASISLIKSVTGITDSNTNGLTDAGDTVTFGFTVTNTGPTALGNVTITDPLVAVAGGPVTLAVGASDTGTFTASYVLTQADVDAGYVQNSATANGDAVTSGGAPIVDGGGAPITVSDVSDTGTNPDGSPVASPATTETPDGTGTTDADPTNDPTVATLAPTPSVRLVKRLVGSTDVNGNGVLDVGDVLNYAFEVTNTGNVALIDVMVTDAIVAVSGGPVTLAVGASDTSTFTASYTLVPADITRGYVENTALATGTAATSTGTPILDAGGSPIVVTDVSDTGTNADGSPVTNPEGTETPDGTGATDGNTTNDPTVVILGRPAIALDIAIVSITDTNGNGINDAGDVIVYSFTVTNTGTVDLTNVNMDPASLSLPMPGLACTSISLAVGATQTLSCTGNTHTITPADVGVGTVTLSGTATGTSTAGVVVSDDDTVVSPVLGLGGGLNIAKTVNRSVVNPGEVISYTITVGNTSAASVVTDVVDRLPAGFIYQSGTATVGGTASEPAISGRTLTWPGVTIAPGGSIVVVLDVLVGAGVAPGNHDNVARAVNPSTGLAVTADAVATVRIAAEPVFACSTVIGRVFDDPNQDGYFNGEPREDRRQITDQTYRAGKYGLPADPGGEKGLPGVRLITPNGLAITTDAHGRFSVPCAALPADIGSNFMLKLDTRTLPSGYRLTTENPRVVRVTPGMLTKMNFGAAISRVVRIDLSAKAFGATGSNKPRAELVAGIRKLVTDIADTPTMLRLSYQLAKGESDKVARTRLRAVEQMLRKLWPANGRYQLNVESVVRRKTAKSVNE